MHKRFNAVERAPTLRRDWAFRMSTAALLGHTVIVYGVGEQVYPDLSSHANPSPTRLECPTHYIEPGAGPVISARSALSAAPPIESHIQNATDT